ncbi:Negative regulator of genetic competence ClpC/MecB [Carnobacterium divergens]|nr:Negative regulator of genetic competence ClpC/MecB [Carnobacterium divergens]
MKVLLKLDQKRCVKRKKLKNLIIKEGKQTTSSKLQVTPIDVAEVVSLWTGIPVQQMEQKESDRLLNLEKSIAQPSCRSKRSG